ncbi:antibiotic biosynthesis monooxygenase [Cyanobium sp. Morenito 9A2]|uniref:antibiotic biosynthesis monooxygenase n=1 Tax=Cyanobium sp. Morenito 9A2 TaxID=2823718 RepID=UPI0020CDB479|nr:antibiotic biosynthesis monooxygenase [Cyanobium sp. Morenito 9A2]MCP9848887.1 antibiotic biosynthesis monooxygenase [Cyanobium sp. Morenito 9A2]
MTSERAHDQDPLATFEVVQRIKPGHEAAFERAMADLMTAAREHPGHLAVNVYRPSSSDDPNYRIIHSFDHLSSLQGWQASDRRRLLVRRLHRHTVDAGQIRLLTGLETWFTLPSRPGQAPPPRHKMLLISTLTVYPLITLINLALQPWLIALPLPLRTLIVTVLMVSLMTYVAMPRMTRLFRRWLYPIAPKP